MFRNITAATIFASAMSLIVIASSDSVLARGSIGGGHSSSGSNGRGSFGGGHYSSSGNGGSHITRSTWSNGTGRSTRSSRNSSDHGHRNNGRSHIRSNSGSIVGTNNYIEGVVAVPAPITILNQAAIGRPVSYSLGQGSFAVDDHGSMVHDGGTQVIAFDRGDNFGTASYTLQPGTYRFVMTDQGMDLRTVSTQSTADQVDVNASSTDN